VQRNKICCGAVKKAFRGNILAADKVQGMNWRLAGGAQATHDDPIKTGVIP
jgi:hypothetical protein